MDNEIILIDGKDYVVLNRINYKNNTYLYVMNEDKEFSVLKEDTENGDTYIESVNDVELVKEILQVILKEYI